MRIKDITRIKGREVITVKPHSPISEVIKHLVTNKIGAVPVCDFKGVLLGIVSERDIVRWMHRVNTDLNRTQAKDIMTFKVYTADPEDDVNNVAGMMIEKGIRHVPVMAGTRCVGILSMRDIMEKQLREPTVRTDKYNEYVSTVTDGHQRKNNAVIASYPGAGLRG